MLGFKSTRSVAATLDGIEMIHMMRKHQGRCAFNPRPSLADQFNMIAVQIAASSPIVSKSKICNGTVGDHFGRKSVTTIAAVRRRFHADISARGRSDPSS